MTSLLATRRRAEEFARHLEQGRTSHDPTMAPLLELAGRLQPSAAAEPSPVFRSALREHLMAVAADLPAEARVEPLPQRTGTRAAPTRARITGFAAAFAVAGTLVAVAAIARGSLPGDALYPVKTRLEGAQVAVATNPESRGRQYLEQSERRLEEMAKLVAKTPVSQQEPEQIKAMGSTLRDFTKDTREAGKLLDQASKSGKGGEAAAKRVQQFRADSSERLAVIGQSLPEDLQQDYDEAWDTIDELEQLVLSLCPLCSTDDLLGSDLIDTDDRPGWPRDDTTARSSSDPTAQQTKTGPGNTPGPVPSQTTGESPVPTSPWNTPKLPVPTVGETPPPTVGLPLPLPLPLPLLQSVPLDSVLPLWGSPHRVAPEDSTPAPSETPTKSLPGSPTSPEPTTPTPTGTPSQDDGLLDDVLGDLKLPLL